MIIFIAKRIFSSSKHWISSENSAQKYVVGGSVNEKMNVRETVYKVTIDSFTCKYQEVDGFFKHNHILSLNAIYVSTIKRITDKTLPEVMMIMICFQQPL